MIYSDKELKAKLQSLLEQGHVDEAFVEDIRDLLEQLRKSQDLQVTIEVRMITLTDNFFERIGVDFDFDVQDSVGGPGFDGGATQGGQQGGGGQGV